MFERLKKEIEKHCTEEAKNTIFFIKNGYCKSWAEEHRNNKDNGLKQYATSATLKAYQNGKITRAQAIEKAIKRALNENEKRKRASLDKLTEAENAPDINKISLQIEWKKSAMWGFNPFCECWAGGQYTTGRASGCGYDKRTASTAEAFNQNISILKLLYIAEEKRLSKQKSKRPSRRDFIGYGSGYNILPSFEGGVGISAHKQIFENIGFLFETTADTKTVDAYTITRKAGATK